MVLLEKEYRENATTASADDDDQPARTKPDSGANLEKRTQLNELDGSTRGKVERVRQQKGKNPT